MLLGEIMQLEAQKQIIIIEGNPPILSNKSFWYEDADLKKRILGASVVPQVEPVLIPFDKSLLSSVAPVNSKEKLGDDN